MTLISTNHPELYFSIFCHIYGVSEASLLILYTGRSYQNVNQYTNERGDGLLTNLPRDAMLEWYICYMAYIFATRLSSAHIGRIILRQFVYPKKNNY